VSERGSDWDETLYRGSAAHYAQGRLAYPAAMADALAQELGLGGRGRLLDVGCGPGSVALVLAPRFDRVVGIDADADMIAEARREAERLAVGNAEWIVMRAEDITSALGTFQVVTFAQSFHWMDQPRVARAVWAVLEPGGAWVHVNAITDRGAESDEPLPSPQPPRDEIRELVHSYLGPVRRAGQGHLPAGTQSGEEDVMAASGYTGPRRVMVERGDLFERTEDQVVASIYSLSWAAPHLFGQQQDEFERDLRGLLRATSPNGRFSERAGDIELVVWRKPA
jgi:SAM-dependent methyltransferase